MPLTAILAAVPTDLSPDEFRAALKRLGFSQVGFARYIGYDDRQVRHWIAGSSSHAKRRNKWPVPKVVCELISALEKLADLQDRIMEE